ncbi:MAG: DUF87 domain-containing protein [Clostridia bacterium]|nr:DUF87 domain-containing protein [Clostridia bacterium]
MKGNNLEILKILPSKVEEKYDCVKIEDKYICIMTVISYEKIVFLEFLEQLLLEEEIRISFHISKQNGGEFLKKITKFVSESGAEIRTIKKNQIDIELLEKNKREAEDIKREVQVNNEEIFLVETYIEIIGKSKLEIESKCNKLKNLLYSKGIILRPTFFKQKEGYKAMLPFLLERKLLSEYTSNVFTTSSCSMLFPFFAKYNITDSGVLVGSVDNNLFKLSLLSKNNLNHNMCVFGSSGVGKSFFVKLLILRKMYKNINQIIIDSEGEYEVLVKEFGGRTLTLDTYNPMQIEESFAKRNQDFLEQTIYITKEYVQKKYNIKYRELEIENHVKDLFKKYKITSNMESLYEYGNRDNIYISPKYKSEFPKLHELLELLGIIDETLTECEIIPKTNLYYFLLKGKTGTQIRKEMELFLPRLKSIITEETLIYFDEIWKLISNDDDYNVIEEIYNFFKTLRKRRAGIVAISQDIGDLFNIDNGNFGKSILNNSYTKAFFKMSYSDMDKMNEVNNGENNIRKEICKLIKGQAYIMQGDNKFVLDVIANDYEINLIEKGMSDEENINSNG